ncbi:MAG: D-glycero-beta-D-manno-heptose-7-phosphate kinase [Candidatus Omnitrophica bacterium]|jgi:D-beta-D-heptose 7-phosphate kinase/D-beta-D-heptose 1-phosphate adenosyltransferase|nr:D-glycero-beta-D-manno-heptose-7-phosphate kinase [Candidatus Omnitrophota bacterium]
MSNLKDIVHKLNKAKVLVIGDLILDEYVWGKVERISPEAPVPVVWANKRTHVPGGAANVANNIRSFDAGVYLAGVIGSDQNARILLAELKKKKINTQGIFVEPQRYTTVKTRIISGHQQVVRVDWEHTEALQRETTRKIFNFIKNNINDFDAIIIEDYGKGVINAQLLEGLILLAQTHKKIVTVDPKEDHFQYYRQVTGITPNRKELENAVRHLKIRDNKNKLKLDSDKLFTDKDIDLAGKQVLEYLGLDSLLVTLGEQGMKLFEKGKNPTHIPTVAQEVFDVSGAGDTVISTFTLGLCAGASKLEAAHIANFAAGIVVGKIGTATTTREELLKRLA